MKKPAGDDMGVVKITLQPLSSKVPASVRIRRLLKIALRALDLRCLRIEEGRAEEEGQEGSAGPSSGG